MPVLKKLKYDFGHGEVVVTVKMDSKGVISSDIPSYVWSATGIHTGGCQTLQECIDRCNNAYLSYTQLTTTVERVILVEFRRENAPFLNEGRGMHLNYLVADKVSFGRKVKYHACHQEMFNSKVWRRLTNEVERSIIHGQSKGVNPGHSVEIPFSEEAYAKIEDIHKRLDDLCDLLAGICGSQEGIMALVEGNLNLLLGQKAV